METDGNGGGDKKRRRKPKYTCREYRAEMRLLALLKQLEEPGVAEDKRSSLEEEVRAIERELGM